MHNSIVLGYFYKIERESSIFTTQKCPRNSECEHIISLILDVLKFVLFF